MLSDCCASAEIDDLEKTVLRAYYYVWNADETDDGSAGKPDGAVVIGTFAFVNHAYKLNARNEPAVGGVSIAFCFISRGAEILICYGGASDERTPLWFDVV